MDTGAIIGIVIGSIVLITIIFCLFARKSNDREFKIIETGSHRTLFPRYPEYPPAGPMTTYPRPLPPPNYLASSVVSPVYPQPPPMSYQMGGQMERGGLVGYERDQRAMPLYR